jgi:FolB domain-containing protein
MDQVIIKDLVVRGIIGVNDWERERAQEIMINIIIFTDVSKAGLSDNIKDSVNYKTVAKKVIEHSESVERYTVEALATDIANLCLEDKKVKKVCVRVEKPGAVRFVKSVGVEIEREQKGF